LQRFHALTSTILILWYQLLAIRHKTTRVSAVKTTRVSAVKQHV